MERRGPIGARRFAFGACALGRSRCRHRHQRVHSPMFRGENYWARVARSAARGSRSRWALRWLPAFGRRCWPCPSLAQTQPDVVVQEFTGSNLPGVNLVWAAVLIGVAVIVLVAQQITHRLALRREADARGDLSRRLIEARERLAAGPFALIEWSGAARHRAGAARGRAAQPQPPADHARGSARGCCRTMGRTPRRPGPPCWRARARRRPSCAMSTPAAGCGCSAMTKAAPAGCGSMTSAETMALVDEFARGGARLHGTARPAADADLVPRREPRHHLRQPGVPPPARPAAGRGAALGPRHQQRGARPRRPRAEARHGAVREPAAGSRRQAPAVRLQRGAAADRRADRLRARPDRARGYAFGAGAPHRGARRRAAEPRHRDRDLRSRQAREVLQRRLSRPVRDGPAVPAIGADHRRGAGFPARAAADHRAGRLPQLQAGIRPPHHVHHRSVRGADAHAQGPHLPHGGDPAPDGRRDPDLRGRDRQAGAGSQLQHADRGAARDHRPSLRRHRGLWQRRQAEAAQLRLHAHVVADRGGDRQPAARLQGGRPGGEILLRPQGLAVRARAHRERGGGARAAQSADRAQRPQGDRCRRDSAAGRRAALQIHRRHRQHQHGARVARAQRSADGGGPAEIRIHRQRELRVPHAA